MISPKNLAKLYAKGASTIALAKLVGVSQACIYETLKREGVVLRPAGGATLRIPEEKVVALAKKYGAEEPRIRDTFEKMLARMTRGYDYVTQQDLDDMEALPRAAAVAFNPRRLPPSVPLWRNCGDI